jgi:hypothetical protein
MLGAIALVESGTKAVLESKRNIFSASPKNSSGGGASEEVDKDEIDSQRRFEVNFRRLLKRCYHAATEDKDVSRASTVKKMIVVLSVLWFL